MFHMIAADITAPYSAAEAWAYDTFIATAVTQLMATMAGPRLDGVARGGAVLDVGCGGGQNLLWLADNRPDLALTGLDLSPRQVARARRRAAARDLPIEVVEGSALDLPFDAGRFDAVLSLASIKHWPDPARGLAECARVLAPGGRLLVVEADRGCHLDDARAFVDRTRVPRLLAPVALAGFRTWVAGQGLDLDDARALVADLGLDDARAERLPGTPALVLEGTRPRAAG
ncbi:MAG: class I SAM-dependent methyltransferase [Kofleriaceae bacterium]|nr:class I SAM-dependent methyltransferase [Kofleriaceae bacterium]